MPNFEKNRKNYPHRNSSHFQTMNATDIHLVWFIRVWSIRVSTQISRKIRVIEYSEILVKGHIFIIWAYPIEKLSSWNEICIFDIKSYFTHQNPVNVVFECNLASNYLQKNVSLPFKNKGQAKGHEYSDCYENKGFWVIGILAWPL